MNERITYAVFYRTEPDNGWSCFSGWFYTYEEAKSEARHAKKNPRYVEVRIVERVESFEFVG
jgi:hypothetical protein